MRIAVQAAYNIPGSAERRPRVLCTLSNSKSWGATEIDKCWHTAKTIDCKDSCPVSSGIPQSRKLLRRLRSSSSSRWSCNEETWVTCEICACSNWETRFSREVSDASPVESARAIARPPGLIVGLYSVLPPYGGRALPYPSVWAVPGGEP